MAKQHSAVTEFAGALAEIRVHSQRAIEPKDIGKKMGEEISDVSHSVWHSLFG